MSGKSIKECTKCTSNLFTFNKCRYSPWFSKQQKGPRLVIRSEDLVLYPEKVVTEVCRCLGGSIGDHFRNKAPSHLEHSVKRGLELYSKGTLEAISKVLDREISDVMGYGITERQ